MDNRSNWLEPTDHGNAARFKLVTGGAPITARRLGSAEIEYFQRWRFSTPPNPVPANIDWSKVVWLEWPPASAGEINPARATPTADTTGRPYARVDSVKEGDLLIADDGFTCIASGAECAVLFDEDPGCGGLYVECAEGKHLLVGQVEGEIYISLYPAPETDADRIAGFHVDAFLAQMGGENDPR